MDLKELKALLRLMESSDVEELEVEEGGRRVRIRRRPGQGVAPFAGPQRLILPTQPSAKGPATANVAPEMAGLVPIESPMVGTFYRAPAPGADLYVKEGDFIQKGSVVCIIEAMKLMNEIESDFAGELVKKFVSNGQPVEYGQPLFAVRGA